MTVPSNYIVFEAPSPVYLIDEGALLKNAKILRELREKSGCKILLAQKAFSCYPFYPMLSDYLDGAASSGLFEARLAREEMKEESEVHVYQPAYSEDDFESLIPLVDAFVFNSFEQWEKYSERVIEHNLSGERQISCGLRINPGYSEVEVALYDPARPDSRHGVPAKAFKKGVAEGRFEGLSGIHFHSLCEQGADTLERTLDAIDASFGRLPKGLRWVNLGGGHLITKDDYDRELLIRLIGRVADQTGATVYLEPGEAVALNAGWLLSTVLDLFRPDEGIVAIMDSSAACHMPDVLEMPYTPQCYLFPAAERSGKDKVFYRGERNASLPYRVTLAGPTCLSGDVIGSHSFEIPPLPGDRIVFTDMAIYTMCKNNTFNGIPLPSIAMTKLSGELKLLRRFGYNDFKSRLG